MTYIIVRDETIAYIQTVCIVWLIMIGFFIIMTFEAMLLIGIVFPTSIILLLKGSPYRSRPRFQDRM